MTEEKKGTDSSLRMNNLASVFDNLVTSNLALTTAVGRLVKLSWAIILLNGLLLAVVITMLAWTMTRVHA